MQQLYEEKEEKKESQKKGFFKRFGKKAYKIGLHAFAVFGIIAMFGLMIVGCHPTNKGQTEKPKSALRQEPKKSATLTGTNLTIKGTYDFNNATQVGSSAGISQNIDTTNASGTITVKDVNENTYYLQISRVNFYEYTGFLPQTSVGFYGDTDYPNIKLGALTPATYNYYDSNETLQIVNLKEAKFSNVNGTFASQPQNFAKWQTWLNNKEIQTQQEYTITTNLTNCTWAGDNTITEGETASGTLTASNNYTLTPAMVNVTGATATITQGAWPWVLNVALSNPTGNVTITATAQYNGYQITPTLGTGVRASSGNPTEIMNNGTATLTYNANFGYHFEEGQEIEVTGATATTNVSENLKTLTLNLSNPTGAVSYSVNATPYGNQTFTFTDDYNGTATGFPYAIAEKYGYSNYTATKVYNELPYNGTFTADTHEFTSIIHEWTKLQPNANDYYLSGNWRNVGSNETYIWVLSGMWFSGETYYLNMDAYEEMSQTTLNTLEGARNNVAQGYMGQYGHRVYYVGAQSKIYNASDPDANQWGTGFQWANNTQMRTITFSADGEATATITRLNIDGQKQTDSTKSFGQWLRLGVNGSYTPEWGEQGNVFSIITAGFTSIIPLLNIAVLPGISLGLLLFIPLVITLIIVAVKLLKK